MGAQRKSRKLREDSTTVEVNNESLGFKEELNQVKSEIKEALKKELRQVGGDLKEEIRLVKVEQVELKKEIRQVKVELKEEL